MKFLIFSLFLLQLAIAQGATNRFPPPGIPVPEAVQARIEARLAELSGKIKELKYDPSILEALPDVAIYEKAVRVALEHNEFYRTNEFGMALELIEEGLKRAEALANRQAPWANKTGLVLRAFQSRIDGSIQPYGLVVPTGYKPGDGKRYRFDVWLHGRNEKLTELAFMHERGSKPGEFTPADTFVLHPYGRYCNAFKFAGETDVLEAIDAVWKQGFPIDTARIAIRGFSMGGGGVWHLAAHFPGEWVCAAPGAGFAETAEYLKVKPGSVPPWEERLWQWYDATDYALNFFNLPVVAYSGELDKQRQAADIMSRAMEQEGLSLIHLIGPKTGHKYEPETKKQISAIVDTFARIGGPNPPLEVRFTTRTLRYSKSHWLQLLGLEEHWKRADAWARIDPENRDTLSVWVTNVTSFAIDLRPYSMRVGAVKINGLPVGIPHDGSGQKLVFTRAEVGWKALGLQSEVVPSRVFVRGRDGWAASLAPAGRVKRPGLQGPIDDAFMDSFIFVAPGGEGFHEATDAWVRKELERAKFEWRAQFRGEARLVKDAEVSDAHIADSNLVLWGDPNSNALLAKILSKLPLEWNAERIKFGGDTFESSHHLPLLIFPNPLNPERYVVLNSCFTFRGFGSNADQTPKLPDYAILDISRPDPFETGVARAGFFDEQWAIPEGQQ